MGTMSRHTILVVDDEPDVISSLKALLRLDYHVLGATRAAEGMQLLASHAVDVVMTDQRMPEMTGVEFLHRIRGEHPDAVRLLFTGYADMRAVIDAINQGNVYRYIAKPWDPEELQTVIREACERHDLLLERKLLIQELERKNADLERANELKAAFIRIAGHELRTPLTIQLGVARLALKLGGLRDPLPDWLRRLERSGLRLAGRVEQLMTLLNADQFARPLAVRPTDLGALVRAAAEEVRPFVELRRQTLSVDAPPDLGEIAVEGQKIEDSLNQLLLNAIRFTPDGGRIDLSARRTGKGVRIEVVDTGVGIPPESLSHVFEPFFTGFDSAHHSSGDFEFGTHGLGIGLSVVKAFVTLHGGSISVRSEPGQGSTFTIDLPAA